MPTFSYLALFTAKIIFHVKKTQVLAIIFENNTRRRMHRIRKFPFVQKNLA